MPSQPDALFDVADLMPRIVVHCFFDCPKVIRDTDPHAAHAAMEKHYASAHKADIASAVAAFH